MALAEIFRVGVPAIVVPSVVFGANWAFRKRNGYTQTAASDFVLALLIFDGGVVATSEAFQPFVNDPDFRSIVIGWHMTVAAFSAFAWYLMLTIAEPRLEDYYRGERLGFPKLTYAACWMAVFVMVVIRVLFFMVQ